jgi:hypothetical protein
MLLNKRLGFYRQEYRSLRVKLRDDMLIFRKLGASLTKVHTKGYRAISAIRSQISDREQIPRASVRAQEHARA